ncbi:hypothetical protein NSA01_05560 [Anaerofustis stercorihominis]|nr:hypothetical protein [Anaerofustis stercorihominis]
MNKKLYYLSLILLPLYLIFVLPYFETKLDYYYDRFLMTMKVRYCMDIIAGILASIFIFIIVKYYNDYKTDKINKIILLSYIILLLVLWGLSIFMVIHYFFSPYTLFFIVTLYLFMLFIKDNKQDSIE